MAGEVAMIGNINRRLLIANFACFLFAATTASTYAADGGAWIAKAPMPLSRFGIHASVIDGRIFVIGGMHTGSGQDTRSTGEVAVYDPAADKWAHATDMPTARGFFATAVVENRIYA